MLGRLRSGDATKQDVFLFATFVLFMLPLLAGSVHALMPPLRFLLELTEPFLVAVMTPGRLMEDALWRAAVASGAPVRTLSAPHHWLEGILNWARNALNAMFWATLITVVFVLVRRLRDRRAAREA